MYFSLLKFTRCSCKYIKIPVRMLLPALLNPVLCTFQQILYSKFCCRNKYFVAAKDFCWYSLKLNQQQRVVLLFQQKCLLKQRKIPQRVLLFQQNRFCVQQHFNMTATNTKDANVGIKQLTFRTPSMFSITLNCTLWKPDAGDKQPLKRQRIQK